MLVPTLGVIEKGNPVSLGRKADAANGTAGRVENVADRVFQVVAALGAVHNRKIPRPRRIPVCPDYVLEHFAGRCPDHGRARQRSTLEFEAGAGPSAQRKRQFAAARKTQKIGGRQVKRAGQQGIGNRRIDLQRAPVPRGSVDDRAPVGSKASGINGTALKSYAVVFRLCHRSEPGTRIDGSPR